MQRTFIASVLAGFSMISAAATSTLIRDVAVFDGTAMHNKQSVLLVDGKIANAQFIGATPAGAREVRCDGCTLLPGLIDSHVHAFKDQQLPLLFGVTTQLDMFMSMTQAAPVKARMAAGTNQNEVDLFTAGTLVTTPGGHGTEYGFPIPTLTKPEDADAFVKARIDEGSDYIKLVYDDGKNFGIRFTTLDLPTLTAAITAAHRYGKLAVVHVSTLEAARQAVEAGANGIVHLFTDREADDAFVSLAKRKGIFVIATYSVWESASGRAGGAGLLANPQFASLLTDTQQTSLKQTMRPIDASARLDEVMRISLGKLKAAGVPILAGTDAGNAGTLHGASLHRELELLVKGGLTPIDALRAATSLPAAQFGLKDRGAIANGLKADVVLVKGDPSQHIVATRDLVEIWKDGQSTNALRDAQLADIANARALAAQRKPQALPADGVIGQFSQHDGKLVMAAPFGRWVENTDAVMQGKSTVTFASNGTDGLQLKGELRAGAAFNWAGVAFNPGKLPFSPTDLSAAKGIRFKVRGDGGTYALQAFWLAGGYMPTSAMFTAGTEWKEVTYAWGRLTGFDPKAATMLSWVAAGREGSFQFELADVRLIVD